MKTVRLAFLVVCLLLPFLALVPDLSANAPATVTPHTLVKGLAQLDWSHNEDRAALGVSQWFAWGMNSCGVDYAHCTPMNRNWAISAQTFCPPTELLGNEPTNDEPAGHPISTHDAMTSTLAIAALCPNTQLIVANIFLDNGWLAAFFSEYKALSGHEYGTVAHVGGLFDLVGFHIYSNTADDAIDRAMDVVDLPGYHGHFWVTEFGVTDYFENPPRPADWPNFLKWLGLQARIERVYVWTNRTSGPEWDLVNGNGTLTTEGQQYHDWQPASTVWSVAMPLVNKPPMQGYP